MRLGRFSLYWSGRWAWEWRRPFEYWDRYQCGPFYVLHAQTRHYDEDEDAV